MKQALAEKEAHGAPINTVTQLGPVAEVSAWACYWETLDLLDQHHALGGRSVLRIPPHWTAQLLLAKAGVPREFIARAFEQELGLINRRLTLLTSLMTFAPYAAQIEAFMARMPSYVDVQLGYEALEEPQAAND